MLTYSTFCINSSKIHHIINLLQLFASNFLMDGLVLTVLENYFYSLPVGGLCKNVDNLKYFYKILPRLANLSKTQKWPYLEQKVCNTNLKALSFLVWFSPIWLQFVLLNLKSYRQKWPKLRNLNESSIQTLTSIVWPQ